MMVKWLKADFNSMEEDFQKICDSLTGNKTDAEWQKNYDKLKSIYKNSAVVPLKPSTWNALGNTDSDKKLTIEQIKKIVKTNLSDFYRYVGEVVSSSCQAPVVLSTRNRYNLISGNQILMAARLLGIEPKVVIVEWR